MSLLDVGCGPGTITLGLARYLNPGRVVGVDFGAGEVERASASAAEQQVSNVEFKVGDSTDLQFRDGEFDAVFSSAMLEHVPERERAIDEMPRVLKSGGVIGMRGGYLPGSIVGPETDALRRLKEIYVAVWISRGGIPDFGIRQAPLLAERGLEEIRQTASYENRDPRNTDYAGRILTDAFVESVERLGVSTRHELEQLSAALVENSKDPLSHTHVAWIEVTARKPA